MDTQLALLGFFNKLLDMMVQYSLEKIAFLCITYWMTASSPYAGIRLIDLGMKDELVKPWVASASYFKRCTLFGWPGTG